MGQPYILCSENPYLTMFCIAATAFFVSAAFGIKTAMKKKSPFATELLLSVAVLSAFFAVLVVVNWSERNRIVEGKNFIVETSNGERYAVESVRINGFGEAEFLAERFDTEGGRRKNIYKGDSEKLQMKRLYNFIYDLKKDRKLSEAELEEGISTNGGRL